MSSKFGVQLLPVVVSAVVSASVAVISMEVLAPQFAAASPATIAGGGGGAGKVTLNKVEKTIGLDFNGTDRLIKGLRSQINTLELRINGDTSSLASIVPIVKSTAERLYDTCALTSDIFGRSFPDGDQQTKSWQSVASTETDPAILGELTQDIALNRCYAAGATVTGTPSWAPGSSPPGILPKNANPDALYSAASPNPYANH